MRRALLLFLLCATCKESTRPPLDAAVERAVSDGSHTYDITLPNVALDFSMEGCTTLDPSTFECSGKAPFTLQFVPIATPTLSQFQWDFGDASLFEPGETPSHTYDFPGTYTVTVVATGAGGTIVRREKKNAVKVLANVTGDTCALDGQCAAGLSCYCSALAKCAAGPVLGLCASSCQEAACQTGEVCADLMPSQEPLRKEPWQERLCLKACTTDLDCKPYLQCRSLPPYPADRPWVKGCFANTPVDLGKPCMDERGTRRDDGCVGGLCLDVGAKGLCTLDCSKQACPEGTDCATFGNGKSVCLKPCLSPDTCISDPLLACVAPGLGLLGFRLNTATNQNSAYCAPKPCANNATCGLVGRCNFEMGGSHCVPR